MPYRIRKIKGGYQVRSPNRIHAKHTSLRKAKRQVRLLRMKEHQ